MNCVECRDNLVACAEGLLEADQSLQCRTHLEGCADCRAEYEAIACLQEKLIASGRSAAAVSLAGPVMHRVLQARKEPHWIQIMSTLFKNRWGLGLGATAAVAAAMLIMLSSAPKAQATAAAVMTKGAQVMAKLTTVHLRGQLRTDPGDNFSSIDANSDFCTIELWKQFSPQPKWRVDKPGRIALMDGQSTLLYLKEPANTAVKIPQVTSSAFDTEWLHRIANLSETITLEVKHAQQQGWKLELTEELGADGKSKSIVTVHAKSGLPDDDYVKNKFFHDADTRRVYRFDGETGRLEAVQIFLNKSSGETQIFDLTQIDYNQPIAPEIWQLDLPANVNWYKEPQKLPDNEKYASMTADQAASAFFEACGRSDWKEVEKFMSPVNTRTKNRLGGLAVIKLGDSFSSDAYYGRFVPYEIKLKSGEVLKHNLAIRNDNPTHRWQVDGGL